MPNLNSKVPGDNVYPQYNRIIKIPVGTGELKKGFLYTLNAAGQLVAAGATRGSFANGLYQATEDVPAHATAGTHTAQVYAPGSRVLIKAPAGIVSGSLLEYTTGTTHVLKAWTLTSNTTSADILAKVGRAFEIYTQSDIAVEKYVTVADDVVIVELGQS